MLSASHSDGHGHSTFHAGAGVPHVSGEIDGRGRATVLVVVGDSWLQAFLVDLLVGEGYRVMDARSGVDGLRLARQDPPDVIVLDLELPGKCGLEVLRELKTDAATRTIPIIVMSDATRLTLAREVGGAEAVLQKPFEFARILVHLERALVRVGRSGRPAAGARHAPSRGKARRNRQGAP